MTQRDSPNSRTRRRRRENEPGGRGKSHQVRVSAAEAAVLARLAAQHRVSVPRLLVESTLSRTGETPTERRDAMVELFKQRRLLAAVSNNVNQLARHANAGDEFPRQASAALAAVRRVTERIDATLDRLAKP